MRFVCGRAKPSIMQQPQFIGANVGIAKQGSRKKSYSHNLFRNCLLPGFPMEMDAANVNVARTREFLGRKPKISETIGHISCNQVRMVVRGKSRFQSEIPAAIRFAPTIYFPLILSRCRPRGCQFT